MILKITRNNRHSLSFSWMDLDPFFRLIIKFEANFSPNDGNGCNETLKNFRIFIFILFLVLALVGNLNYLFYTYKLLCFIILLRIWMKIEVSFYLRCCIFHAIIFSIIIIFPIIFFYGIFMSFIIWYFFHYGKIIPYLDGICRDYWVMP